MSEQQTETATATTANRNELDTREPDAERQNKLRAAYEANVAAGNPPYEGVGIGTLGELRWILRQRDWSTDIPGKQCPDLRSAFLLDVNLSGADLSLANLSGADLSLANLSGADLSYADLSGAELSDANLSRADLTNANLSGADLTNANLSGADLREARLNRDTRLAEVTLDAGTRLGDIDWQGVPLTRVASWPERLGDEQDIAEAENRRERIDAYLDAARAYRGLSIALRGQGLLIPASDYRLREQVLERKAKFLEFSLLGWVFSWLLNLVAGYGERPVRAFFAYLLVLFGFAGLYYTLGAGLLGFLGLGTHDAIHTPLSALVFSVTSFHGRGFFPGGLALDDPITVLAALEAVIGLFIEITFIATFTQRFFGGR